MVLLNDVNEALTCRNDVWITREGKSLEAADQTSAAGHAADKSVRGWGVGGNQGKEAIPQIGGDALHLWIQRIHVLVLQHLLADQPEPFLEGRHAGGVEQRQVVRLAVATLEFERSTDTRGRAQAAAAAVLTT